MLHIPRVNIMMSMALLLIHTTLRVLLFFGVAYINLLYVKTTDETYIKCDHM